jgi:RNA polymerase sigma factor (TIGR02999 family)
MTDGKRTMGEMTQLIERAGHGERSAFDRIFEILYPDLRSIAHRRLSLNARNGSLDTTALVNECYLKLVQRESLKPADRAHFLGYAASVMRSIIVDAARLSRTNKRGGDQQQVTLDTGVAESLAHPADEIIDIDGALEQLGQVNQRLVRVVEMRYFGGLKDSEIAQALDLTERTVQRDWEKARLLLAHALRH